MVISISGQTSWSFPLFSDPLSIFVFLYFSHFFSVNVNYPFHIPLGYLKALKE